MNKSPITITLKLLTLTFLSSFLIACGGGGSGTDTNVSVGEGETQTISVSGVVADGYLEGAIVFLDLNDNKVLDENEPSTTTDASGSYTLPAVNATDVATHSVVVDVPAHALDSDTGAAVGNAYILTAPAGLPEFISPLTTLIQEMLERFPGMDLEAAEALIKTNLEVSSQVSLFQDYIKDGASSSSTANDSRIIHNAARVIADYLGNNTKLIETALGGSIVAEKRGPVARLIAWEVIQQLPDFQSYSSSTDLGMAEVNVLSISMAQVGIASLEANIAQQLKAEAISFFDVMQGDGIYQPAGLGNGGGYSNLKTNDTNSDNYSVSQVDFEFSAGQYIESQPYQDTYYILSPTGWVLSTDLDPIFHTGVDGVTSSSDVDSDLTATFSISQIDLSGVPIQSLDYVNIEFQNLDIRFPDGANAYRMVAYSNKIEYEIRLDDVAQEDNPQLELFDTLDLVIQNYSYELAGLLLKLYGLKVHLSSDQKIQIITEIADCKLVAVCTGPQSIGTWERKNINGVEVLVLNIQTAYKKEYSDVEDAATDQFITILNGKAVLGTVTMAGLTQLTWLNEIMYFNKVALDSIIANATQPEPFFETFGVVAADGYITGATVFLDLNDNSVLDRGEPLAETDGGAYSLLWNNRDDFASHSLVALIPADATSFIVGTGGVPVMSAYKLIAPAGVVVITPMSTLIWHELYTNEDPNKTLNAAEETIKGKLGLSFPTTVNLLETYLPLYPDDATRTQQVNARVADMLQQSIVDAHSTSFGAVAQKLLDTNNLEFFIASVGVSKVHLGLIVSLLGSVDYCYSCDIYDVINADVFLKIFLGEVVRQTIVTYNEYGPIAAQRLRELVAKEVNPICFQNFGFVPKCFELKTNFDSPLPTDEEVILSQIPGGFL